MTDIQDPDLSRIILEENMRAYYSRTENKRKLDEMGELVRMENLFASSKVAAIHMSWADIKSSMG